MSQILKPKKGYKLVKKSFGKDVEIPEEWKVITLKNILLNQNSGLHNKLEKSKEGDNIVGMFDLYNVDKIDGQIFTLAKFPKTIKGKKVEKEKYIFEENDFVYIEISLVKEGIGKTVCVTKNGAGTFFAGNLRRFKINDIETSPEFLYYYLNANPIRNYMISTSYTSAQTGITTKDYFNVGIIMPLLPEQHKIASILSNIDNLIVNTQKIIDQTKSIKKGLMQKLFTSGINHKKFKKVKWLFGKEIKIPEEWEVKQLDDILEIVQYGISKPMFEEGEYPIFRMNSIQESEVIELDMKFIDLTKEEFKNYKLEKEDLLFNRTNSYDLVGKIGIFLLEGNFTFAGYLIRLRTNEKMNPIFLNNYLNTKQSRYNVKRFATPAVSQTNINATNLKSVIITVPTRQEQDKIASVLSNADSQIQSHTQYKEKLERLKKSLMQKLLTGQVRVAV